MLATVDVRNKVYRPFLPGHCSKVFFFIVLRGRLMRILLALIFLLACSIFAPAYAKDCSQLGTNCTLAEAQEQCVVEHKPGQWMQWRSVPYSQYQCNNRPTEGNHAHVAGQFCGVNQGTCGNQSVYYYSRACPAGTVFNIITGECNFDIEKANDC